VRRVITLNRRRVVLGAICAGLVVLPAAGGWSAEHWRRTDAASPSAPPSAPPSGSPSPLNSPSSLGSLSPLGSPSSPGSPSSLGSVPGGDLGGPVEAPGPGRLGEGEPDHPGASAGTIAGSDLGPPIGWKLSDVPQFGPRPAPEPIVLPPGDEVPFLSRVPVTQKVAFLTIDDGFLKNPEAPKLFAAAGIPVTLFLTTDAIQDNVPFFDRLRNYGAVIEAHTISHPELAGKSESFQRQQICAGADRLGQWYGRRPVLFRPPFGDKNSTTLRVAKSCGIKAAFMWKETIDKGKVRYQEGRTIQPGDIILMHFRPAFVKDFLAALRAIHKAGLTPALLEDYVPLTDGPPPTRARRPGVQD
jgi:peptidoglycan/xylan/chitin deacetylase (PgdA/CDA1 family)